MRTPELHPLLTTFLLIAAGTVHATPILSDDFNDNSTDLAKWTVFQRGTGPAVVEQNGRLEITIPAGSSGGDLSAGYLSAALLVGDFDAQIDYTLINWPIHNGVRFGIGTDLPGTAVERISFSNTDFFPPGDFYLTHFFDAPQGFVPASAQTGRLRVTRTGSQLSGYYWNGSDWVLIDEGPGTAAPAHFSAVAFSHDSVLARNGDVVIAYDNFQLRQGADEPSEPVPDGGDSLPSLALVFGSLLLIHRTRMNHLV